MLKPTNSGSAVSKFELLGCHCGLDVSRTGTRTFRRSTDNAGVNVAAVLGDGFATWN